MKSRVAIIDSVGAHGSSFHYYVFGQAIGLIKSGLKISVYTNDETENPKIESLDFYQTYKNIYKSKYRLLSAIRYLRASVYSIIHARSNGCKIFHFHLFDFNLLILFNILICRISFSKAVLTIHDVKSFDSVKKNNLVSRLIYKLSSALITHNIFSRDEIKKDNKLSNHNIHIIPHGNYLPFINVQKDKSLCRKELELPKNKKIILFFGMIKKVKGLEVLLRAMKKIKANNKDIVLLVAGKCYKNDFAFYQQIIDKNKLNDNCILHIKFIPDEDVEYYYGACDLVVLPYTRIYQSGVLLMSLSYRKPTLVSDLDPLTDIITHNKTGYIFKSQDPNDLSQKIVDILNDENSLQHVNKNAYQHVKKKYSWEAIGSATKRVYQTLIE